MIAQPYNMLLRERRALRALLQHPETPWADLVGDYGYYDQPHFNREFVALTGLRPEDYRARVGGYRAAPPPNHVGCSGPPGTPSATPLPVWTRSIEGVASLTNSRGSMRSVWQTASGHRVGA